MIADIEDQLAAYAGWLEDRTGVALARSTAEDRGTFVEAGTVWPGERRSRPHGRTVARFAAVAAVAAGVVGVAVVVDRGAGPDAPAPGTGGAATSGVSADVEWFALADDLGRDEVATEDRILLCRSVGLDGTCDALVGSRTVTYDDGLTITTEYGPTPSTAWQMLATSTMIGDRAARAGADGAIGVEMAAGQRVLVAGGDESVVGGLEPRASEERLPLVFGEAIADAVDLGDGARYFAAYLDTSGAEPCVGGVGIPWNNEESCVPTAPGTLAVTIATPSPVGTILVATAPVGTARLVASSAGGSSAELSVTHTDDFVLGFGSLGGLAPTQLKALDASGVELGRVDMVSTGGAPLGYVPGTGPSLQLLLPSDDVVPSYAQRNAALPQRTLGLVQAPSGATYSVNVTEDFWGELPAEFDQRTIGATTWATGEEDSNRAYVSIAECAMVSVSAGPDRTAWSDEALAMLAAVEAGDPITFDLPEGWSTLAVGPFGEWFGMSFDPGDGLADVTLTQMPGSSAGPILADLVGRPTESVVFRDTPAWLVTLDDAGWSTLVWADDRGAFSIQSKDRSLDQLAAIVDGLSTVSVDEWQQRYAAIDAGPSVQMFEPTCEVPGLVER